MTEHQTEVLAAEGQTTHLDRPSSLWGDAWRNLRRNPVFVVSSLVVLLLVSMALFPQLWTSADPQYCDITFAREKPSADHIFGYSVLGCDYYAQTIYGARPSITVAVVATTGVVLIGGLTGVFSGYYGGWLDSLLSRFTEVFLSIPFLLGGIVFLSLLQTRQVWTVAAALMALGWPPIMRIMRSSVIATRHMDYVQASRAVGAKNRRIIFRHILPNAVAPVIVYATIALGSFVAVEATLSYLGIGLVPPAVSWGIMINQGQAFVASGYPHLLLFPATFLAVTVLSFILLGDALRDALDPKLR